MGVALYEGDINSTLVIGLPVFQRAVDTLRVFSEQVLKRQCTMRFEEATTQCDSCWQHHHLQESTGSGLYWKVHSNGHYYIYNRPLKLPTIESVSSLEELAAIVFTASTSMIFNTALAWHQLGECTGRDDCKIKAGQNYDVVAAILDAAIGGTRHRCCTNDLSLSVLKCLVLNNRAQLYYESCDYVNSEHCVREMRDLLALSDSLEPYLDDDEVDELRLNMVSLRPPTVAHAA
jgi:hypothetical protein